MNQGVVVGLCDSGIGGMPADRILECRRFALDEGGDEVVTAPPRPDILGHGTVLGRLILGAGAEVRLLCAQVFDARGVTAPAVVAAGIDWLVAAGARIVNLSLGLTADRPILRQACADALARGAILVAAVPAIGATVFPAAYPGVLRVTGDARCRGDELAALADHRADIGACPWPLGEPAPADTRPGVAGASVAAARVTGLLARQLARHRGQLPAPPATLLAAIAAHRGPQQIPSREVPA